jgi:hypothetical protein
VTTHIGELELFPSGDVNWKRRVTAYTNTKLFENWTSAGQKYSRDGDKNYLRTSKSDGLEATTAALTARQKFIFHLSNSDMNKCSRHVFVTRRMSALGQKRTFCGARAQKLAIKRTEAA